MFSKAAIKHGEVSVIARSPAIAKCKLISQDVNFMCPGERLVTENKHNNVNKKGNC